MNPQDLVLTRRGLRWRGQILPCTIGRGGIALHKREGDGATPAGTHRVTGLLYRADRMPRPAPWARAIGPRDLWSDDPEDPAYNRQVCAPHGYNHESLRRADPLYDLVLLTDWNTEPARPGHGSAIFLHQWRRPGAPTEGCIAFARADIRRIATAIAPGTRLIVPAAPFWS